MGIVKQSKLNFLMRNWPDGQIKSSHWLLANGYSASLLQKYKTNHWIESIGTGAYKKAGDKVTWESALDCLQNQFKSEIYVGGKSAIELAGKAQYIKMKETSVILLSNKKESLPAWYKNENWNLKLDFKVKNLFNASFVFGEKSNGFVLVDTGRVTFIASSAERAYLEYLDELTSEFSYTEAQEIMENLITIRPKMVQHLLENCTSIKVKRLFLHLAEKINHPWFKKLNLQKIDLGSGKRVLFKNGILDTKYNITVPKVESYEEF